MNGNFKLSRIATFLAGCSFLVGCGSDDASSTPNVESYAYSKLSVCIDADLDGFCGELEQKVRKVSRTSDTNQAPYLINEAGYFLTAPASATVVTPFTTLIQNEVLYNPLVAGDTKLAQQQLQAIFGEKYGIDFNQLASMHGPKAETEMLLASFRHALSLQGGSSYLKISAAVDKMISEKSFDITQSLTQSDLDTSYVNLNNRYLLSGSYPVNSLFLPDSITMNEGTGMLLALLSDKKLLQVNSASGSYSSFSPTVTTEPGQKTAKLASYDSHHDDDDDDDDDHHGGGGIVLPPQNPSILTHATQGKDDREAYLLYQPSIVGDSSISNTCNATSTNGIFLSEIGKNNQTTKLTASTKIDAYGGASGGTTIPPITPPVSGPATSPVAEVECLNNHINGLTPLYKKSLIAAVFTNGSSYNSELQLLSSTELKQLGKRYPLSSTKPLVIANKSQSQLVVVETNSSQAVILDSSTLSPKANINKSNIQSAVFANNDSELVVSDGGKTLSWFNVANPGNPPATLVLDDNIIRLVSDPSGLFSAVQTSNHIHLINNQTRSIIKSEPYEKSMVYGINMLSDKIIISRSKSIDYMQFGNLIGSPIKVGYQLVNRELVNKWASASNNSFSSTTLSYVLQSVGESADISQEFNNIDLEWLPADATTANGVKAVMISGYYRNERVSLYKSL
ncbi:hypothetical protein BIT28_07245 [Photobacterium proteolyticum]|uniref:Uncharacterized protein n=1 Tax=Photobacterium proteolyticum TaxID=1903952 RepID=A0A1Q9GEY8_9GAMM|nr:hypothetical protein [Photobacterium proteolyticum]OLQ72968.1 hypothetical protein BIT28_07245 [Photobacterium proteolyticum]